MTQATRIIAVRHGETTWNAATRIQGQLDIPLNDTGHDQARRLADVLKDEPITAIYSSDLARAQQTASYLASELGIDVRPESALRERGFGAFEGKTFAEIETTLPEQSLRWRTRDPAFAPTGGESLIELRTRVVGAAERLAAKHLGELIVMVGHGGVMDVLYRAATRLDIQAPRTWALDNAAINRLLWTRQGFSLVGWADTQHLEASLDDQITE